MAKTSPAQEPKIIGPISGVGCPDSTTRVAARYATRPRAGSPSYLLCVAGAPPGLDRIGDVALQGELERFDQGLSARAGQYPALAALLGVDPRR
eukprot:1495157-Pyramimonas_sp.AAC.1